MVKTVVRFFTIADYEEEEIWLREQHKKGYKLIKVTPPCFYSFEACEPEDVIYRLDYNNYQNQDYIQMLNDFGWEYFAECLGWLYLRKAYSAVQVEEEGELFSDNESRLELVSSIARTKLLPLALIFLCSVLPNFIRTMEGEYVGITGTIFGCVFGFLFIVYVFLLTYCGLKLKTKRE